jgi:hypothetical protein
MANGWGGRRPGAGRKPGSKTKKTAIIAQQARDAGISPLEVMLNTMRRLWQLHLDGGDLGLAVQACAIAREAAPFCHPRFCGIAYQELGSDRKPEDAAPPGVTVNVHFVRATTAEESPRPEASPEVRRPIALEHEPVLGFEHEPVPGREAAARLERLETDVRRPKVESASISPVGRPVQRCWDENGFSGRPVGRRSVL